MRRNAIVRLCIWSVIAVSLIGLLATWFINNTNIFQSGGTSFMSIGLSSYRYKNADRYTAGNAEFSDQVTSLDIDWISGSVTVLSYDGDTVRIREDGDIIDPDYQVHWFLGGGKLHIKYTASKFFFRTPQNKNLTVEIPSGMARYLSSVEIDVVSASVELREIKTNELKLESVSGGINLEKIAANSLNLDTVSGAITATNLNVPLIDVDTVSGEISLSGQIGQGSVDTTSGDVTLSSNFPFEALDLETVSGDVTLICPLNALNDGCRIVFESVSGDIESELPLKKNGNNYTFGSGKFIYNFDGVSGDLFIKQP
ncbi:MAG: DUF4097 domain-containing protein [Ruminococcaceae bacterium]|nr:DUF4097 domain-containing protein [Oscillospiraceae bacterium]